MSISKAAFPLLALVCLAYSNLLLGAVPPSPQMTHKDVVHGFFRDIIENPEVDPTVVAKYLTPDYVQYVDGVRLDYPGFIEHMTELKRVTKSTRVTFKHLVAEGEAIATVHQPHSITKKGHTVNPPGECLHAA